jgi:CheY-like chemotaxis protein
MSTRSQTILLVEDEEDDIFFMQRALNKACITSPLRVVKNGRDAVAYLSGSGVYADRKAYPLPDLILLDLRLPYILGLDVLRWIRSQPELQSRPVVVLTSSKEKSDVERAYRLGANSYLVKPPDTSSLGQMVKSLSEYWLTFNTFPVPPETASLHPPA